MTTANITLVTTDELTQLHDISVETFAATFGAMNTPENLAAYLEHDLSPEQLRQELATPTDSFYFIKVNDQLAGYGKLRRHADNLEIQRVYVRKAFQHHGLGRQFLEFAEQTATTEGFTKLTLGVWEHNTNALAFYKVMGYQRYGAHTFDLGSDHQTDFLMEKSL
ncbi:GNAT family N-acetyltransferase [Levilactobacillus tujiorum]|uniref:GNAT family N-acetyltransferase n=1 Tax=Levilactobacillus tujiorum TaxID=2912243 RepID=UPI001E342E9B|nr:GNAT family N-acetyltransferase [Levilactobacillus tujiorum]